MNSQVTIARSRGAVSGGALILLGLWGGLAPFVGPYFHFGYTPDKAWAWTSGRLYYSVIPGAVALVAGALLAVTRSRVLGVTAGTLAALAGGSCLAPASPTTCSSMRRLRPVSRSDRPDRPARTRSRCTWRCSLSTARSAR